MEYCETIQLKDGRECCLRNGTEHDAQGALNNFILTHGQTDNLLTYPDESQLTVEDEAAFLRAKTESPNEIEIIAIVDDDIVGTAGLESRGSREKVRHRVEFGISIDRAYWGLGIGRALTQACIACARQAGYAQVELDVVAENEHAIELYKRAGFVEYGRNPRGFRTRSGRWQELILMCLPLDE